MTYTVRVVYPGSRSVVFYDPVPTYTTFVSGSLVAPPGVAYDPVEGAVAGPLDLAAGVPATVTFAVRVAVTGTLDFSPRLANRACVHPPAGGLAGCEWSNEVSHPTHARLICLPLVTRSAGP